MHDTTPLAPGQTWVGEIDPGETWLAVPGARAKCLECDELLIAKCGEINRWHWAHEAGNIDCVGSGSESAWHVAWKMHEASRGAEVEVRSGSHRADVVRPDGTIVELQSAYLDSRAIAAREQHYGDKLIWIYRITQGRWDRLWNAGDGWFNWRRPATSMLAHERPVKWHHRDRLYDVTLRDTGDGVQLRFSRGEDDKYGPVLYGSTRAPFAVLDAHDAVQRYAA